MSIKQHEITAYYDELSESYDDNRFNNTYGKYIHDQEILVLNKYFHPQPTETILDIACGTGRFLEYASHGVDVSEAMLKVARSKHPTKEFICTPGSKLPLESEAIDAGFSFHLFMHLDSSSLQDILNEVYRVTRSKGRFMFDIPSADRRRLSRYKVSDWHGAFSISPRDLKEHLQGKWKLIEYRGIAFFSVHLIPKGLRAYAMRLDNLLCRSLLRRFSSHIVYVVQKHE